MYLPSPSTSARPAFFILNRAARIAAPSFPSTPCCPTYLVRRDPRMPPDDRVELLLALAARGPLRPRRCLFSSSGFFGSGRLPAIPQGGLERLDGFEPARDLGQLLLGGLDALLGLWSGPCLTGQAAGWG